MWRQGDLLILKVDKIPGSSVKQTTRILARGEATGHVHEIDTGELYYDSKNDTLYFKVPEGESATLNHQEHEAIKFEPGDYLVLRQREYRPDGWQYVSD